MKIRHLEISNFRGIEHAQARNIGDLVVIAGPNGSGKSCLLDAIRLIKSSYGGYQVDEYNQWMGEFQINRRTERWEIIKLLRHNSRSALIEIGVAISDREVEYLQDKSRSLMEEEAIKLLFPNFQIADWRQFKQTGQRFDPNVERHFEETTTQLWQRFNKELSKLIHEARVIIRPDGQVERTDSLVLTTVWRLYQPNRIGVIDYHGPHRTYARESIGGINLSLQNQEERQKHHALYNYGHKYANIKSEMAEEFVQDLLRQKGKGRPASKYRTMTSTLQEMFKTFFPDKEFIGPTTDESGGLRFPVRVGTAEHDINELSSGEKEILYGYLRLRKSAPRDSIVLLDEPELHLNPKLLQGLPQFYESHIVQALDNQMWLVTHSDALLREALATPRATVMHMQEVKESSLGANQLKRVEEDHDVEQAVMELVGDIATYRPGGKIVIFEGAEAGFDVKMTARLFPKHDREMNFIAGGNRSGVERLQMVLDAEDSRVKVFSIVDRDCHGRSLGKGRQYQWGAYHIENYLLDARCIEQVLRDSTIDDATMLDTVGKIDEELLSIARGHIEQLVQIRLRDYIHHILRRNIRVGGHVEGKASDALAERVQDTAQRVSQVVERELTGEAIERKEAEFRRELERALRTEKWREEFRGRDILKEFVNRHCQGVNYQRFRDMVVNSMRQAGHAPPGMRAVLRQIAEQD